MRIAFAGFQHETNTFAPGQAGLAEFRMADSWPGLLQGEAAAKGLRGMNIPMAGALKAAEAAGVEPVPILWCAAEPSGPVTDEAFETIAAMILEGLAEGPLDGLCLDLHGAMVTESYADGEAALLARIREAVGPDLPIAVSLDLHANISLELASFADRITIFRTYPHLDMAETGARALRALLDVIRHGRPAMAFRQAPFLIPLHAQCTDLAPCDRLYGALEEGAEMALGFTAADIPDCGPALLAYAADQAGAEALADAALKRLMAAEGAFDDRLWSPEAALSHAMAAAGPVILADVQDNPGAGGTADTTGILRALVEAGAKRALSGLYADPDLAAAAHQAGEGAVVEGQLGGRSGVPGDAPFAARFRVLKLSDGRIPYTGEMYGGGVAELGPGALLSIEGTDVKLTVSTIRSQCLDRALFTALGADPAAHHIVVVKSTVHFRADFAPIAAEILNVAAPGAFPCDLTAPAYRRLRPGVRLGPNGPAFSPPSR